MPESSNEIDFKDFRHVLESASIFYNFLLSYSKRDPVVIPIEHLMGAAGQLHNSMVIYAAFNRHISLPEGFKFPDPEQYLPLTKVIMNQSNEQPDESKQPPEVVAFHPKTTTKITVPTQLPVSLNELQDDLAASYMALVDELQERADNQTWNIAKDDRIRIAGSTTEDLMSDLHNSVIMILALVDPETGKHSLPDSPFQAFTLPSEDDYEDD
jgi:hypothetical protein